MINWQHPLKKLPKPGQIIWVLLQHWKENGPMSCEIYAGEVCEYPEENIKAYDLPCSLYVENLDDYGQGSSTWNFPNEETFGDCNLIKAWAPASKKDLPYWL